MIKYIIFHREMPVEINNVDQWYPKLRKTRKVLIKLIPEIGE